MVDTEVDLVDTEVDLVDTEEVDLEVTAITEARDLLTLRQLLSQPLTPKPTGDTMEDTEVDMDMEDVDLEVDIEVDSEVDSTDAEDIGDKINGSFIHTQISANNSIFNVRVTHILENGC